MGDNKKTNTPPPNPAKAVKTPLLPTKYTRDDGSNLRISTPKGSKK